MTDYKEEDYLMLSGIQHFAFCRRQWALIHVEQQWNENVRTVEGELLHENAHDVEFTEKRGDRYISRGMPIFSRMMGVSGNCDVVEFCKQENGTFIQKYQGTYNILPIEYKRGSPKINNEDVLQLTAQAMCLEEMFSCNIEQGALYYGETRRREYISFTSEIREQVESSFAEMHKLMDRHYTPKVKWSKACNACSLKDICIPKLGKKNNAGKYVSAHLQDEE